MFSVIDALFESCFFSLENHEPRLNNFGPKLIALCKPHKIKLELINALSFAIVTMPQSELC